MKQRILATATLWILAIGLPVFFGHWGTFALIAVFGTGAFYELLQLLRAARLPVEPRIAIPGFAAMLLAFIFFPPWVVPPMAIVMIGLSLTVVVCLLRSTMGEFSREAMVTTGAMTVMLLPFVSVTLMIHETGLFLPIWVLAVTKFGDVGALLTGLWLGRHKMAPAFSPNKTWEGFTGGILFSVLVSMGFVFFGEPWRPEGFTLLHAVWTSVFISAAGVLGDLTESVLKREANVKDSGRAIPGIGGFFDLTDSMTLAFPVAYFLIWIIL